MQMAQPPRPAHRNHVAQEGRISFMCCLRGCLHLRERSLRLVPLAALPARAFPEHVQLSVPRPSPPTDTSSPLDNLPTTPCNLTLGTLVSDWTCWWGTPIASLSITPRAMVSR